MPVSPTYPGVYIEEIPSGVRTITGVATAITAFIGITLRGPTNQPVRIQSFGDFERFFGGLWIKSALGYAVQQYFLNGGTDAIIIRVVDPTAVVGTLAVGDLNLVAANQGQWSQGLFVVIDHDTKDKNDSSLFNLTVNRIIEKKDKFKDCKIQTQEIIRNISVDPDASRYIVSVLEQESALIRVAPSDTIPNPNVPKNRPDPNQPNGESAPPEGFINGSDGVIPSYEVYLGEEANRTGIYALEEADLFNLLCIPPKNRGATLFDDGNGIALLSAALQYCKKRRAMLIIDPPSQWRSKSDVSKVTENLTLIDPLTDENAAIFYPELLVPDPLKEGRPELFPPCGVVAGIFARTDVQRGVWKAPAGIDATLAGVTELSNKMTDQQNGQLNPLGINCLRSFPVYGNVVWGARTRKGADTLASEWKYLPVRRLALFLEESLYRGTKWVVFEPNDEPLWAQIRLNIGAFMNNLFRQGAFQGNSPNEAYFVKCDKETTTQNDINLGIVNIIVGYAPLKPAEFVILKFQQIAGQIAT